MIFVLIFMSKYGLPNSNVETYSEPCQTSKMERFMKIVIGF